MSNIRLYNVGKGWPKNIRYINSININSLEGKMNNKIIASLLFSTVFIISGCLHEETSVESAQYEFVHQTLTVLDGAGEIFTNIGDDLDQSNVFGSSESDSSFSNAFFKARVADKNKLEIASKLKNLADWRTGLSTILDKTGVNNPIVKMKNKVQARSFLEADNSTDEFGLNEADINEAFNEIFNTPTQEGNVITYSFKTDVCDDGSASSTPTEIQNCIELLNDVTVVFTVLSETSGTVDIKIDNFIPLSYSYSSTRIQMTVDLNAIKQSSETFAHLFEFDDTTNSFPATFKGKVGIYAELTTTHSVELGMNIPESVDIDGSLDGETIKISMSSTSKYFAIGANDLTSTANIELGIGTLIAMYTDEMGDLFELDIPGFTGELSIDIKSESATVSNFGVGSTPITYDINGDRALALKIEKFDGVLSGVEETFTLSTDLDISLTASNIHEDMNEIFDESTNSALSGSFSITASSGLEISNPEADSLLDDVTRIDAGGPLTMVGSGYFLMNESISTGECFIWEDGLNDTFSSGFEKGTCSTWVSGL